MLELNIKLTVNDARRLKEIINSDEPIEDIISKIILEKINYIHIKGGYKYCIENKQLFNKNNSQILFTQIEEDLLHYLLIMSIKNRNDYIDLLLIKKEVWKHDKTTIFSIRNKIMAIRDKTCKELIVSKNKQGYRINIESIY